MIQSTNNTTYTKVNAGDWKDNALHLPYYGKYQVGRFSLSNEFMIQYMALVHGFPTSSNGLHTSNITPADTVMHMEHSDIIDNGILLKMRQMVKNPRPGFSVYADNNVITGIAKDSDNG